MPHRQDKDATSYTQGLSRHYVQEEEEKGTALVRNNNHGRVEIQTRGFLIRSISEMELNLDTSSDFASNDLNNCMAYEFSFVRQNSYLQERIPVFQTPSS